jgi:hypothetical protein
MVALASTGYSLPKANSLTKSPYAPSIARGTLQLFTAALMPQLAVKQTFAFLPLPVSYAHTKSAKIMSKRAIGITQTKRTVC